MEEVVYPLEPPPHLKIRQRKKVEGRLQTLLGLLEFAHQC